MKREEITEDSENIVGFFVQREGKILQSVTELFTGAYSIILHLYTFSGGRSGHFVNQVPVSTVDAMKPLDHQAQHMVRQIAAFLDSHTIKGNDITVIVGGKAKLYDQILTRSSRDLPNFMGSALVTDHTDLLMLGNGRRALSLQERYDLSDVQMIKLMTGAPDAEHAEFLGLVQQLH